MKLITIMINSCLPATTGGRMDPWTRAQGFKQAGCEMFLITWERQDSLPPEQMREYAKVFEAVRVYSNAPDVSGILKRLVHLPTSPHISSRYLSRRQLDALVQELRAFGAEAIWLDGLYGMGLAYELERELRIPILYRSHNIEHLYMLSQARQSRSWRNRIAWRLAASRLSQSESELQHHALRVFEISQDDMEFWRVRGVDRNSWLPTLMDSRKYQEERLAQRNAEYDFGFMGDLTSPNNQVAVDWFVAEVWPILRAARPDLRVLISGRNPPPEIRSALCAAGIDLLIDPPNAAHVWAQSKVFFNPIRDGSGINVKAIEMLMFDAPIVSTSVGVRGLPQEVQEQFFIADTGADFAQQMLEARDEGAVDLRSREAAREKFDRSRALTFIDEIKALL
ncbi:glycosyltransferase [Bryocella elongata]|uniref:glycosyltransferase n=1 Tax=Bryocella elongata TaxID=863522 RepID=UPI000CDF120C|nr:glycosyltransferase [Bryocella elongata]